MNEQDQGVAATPPGCQPSASDPSGSSRSGIPNAAKLTAIDLERLGDLIYAYDYSAKNGFFEKRLGPDYTWDGVSYWDGVAPIDCGGRDGSDHSYRLSKLVRLGFAEHRKGSVWGRASTRHKGSKKYRPTQAGRDVYAQAIEAQRAATAKTGAVEDESAVAKPCAPKVPS